MDMVRVENATGIVSLISAFALLMGIKAAKPYQFITLLVSLVLIAFAVLSASTFSNYEAMAKILNIRHRMSDDALQEALRVNDLWVLIYPALIGASGVNLLTSWLQSRKPEQKEDSIELAVLRIMAEQNASGREEKASDEPPSREPARRPRKNVRAALVRKR
jgi:hypothetical protein